MDWEQRTQPSIRLVSSNHVLRRFLRYTVLPAHPPVRAPSLHQPHTFWYSSTAGREERTINSLTNQRRDNEKCHPSIPWDHRHSVEECPDISSSRFHTERWVRPLHWRSSSVVLVTQEVYRRVLPPSSGEGLALFPERSLPFSAFR